MENVCSVVIEGVLINDSKTNILSSGTKHNHVTIKTCRQYKDSKGQFVDDESYFDIESFGKLAEKMEEKGREGCNVRVIGRLKQAYTTDDIGKKHSEIKVLAEAVIIQSKNRIRKNDIEPNR